MTAYIIVEIDIEDPVRYEKYKKMTPPTIDKYGGRFLARGKDVINLEGDWDPARLVIIEFDNADLARSWWGSEEYRPARELRQLVAKTQMILVEGV